MGTTYNVLTFSCLHEPFSHVDAFDFLKAVADRYNVDRVICLGDETDGHAKSFHEHDPDLKSDSDELDMAIENLKKYYKLFPNVEILNSNHGSLVHRRARNAGLSSRYIKSMNDILGAPKGWIWKDSSIISFSSGFKVLFKHGIKKNYLAIAREYGMCFVQGHFHTQLGIQWYSNEIQQAWGMNVGCLIDNDSLAFRYNKSNLASPVLGCGIIQSGIPKTIPMILDSKQRWVGKL